ncbi:hypothetical protein BHE74_00042682, partial [Ensete ventricosum]
MSSYPFTTPVILAVGMTSSDSSSSVRVVSSPGSGETSRCDPEVGSSGASSGPPSPVDARVLRDLEVMKSDYDLDTTVTEGSLAVIRERYSIPVEYGLHVSQSGQRPYSLDAPSMCISVDALEAGLRFPLHPLIEECLRVVEDLSQPGSAQLVALPCHLFGRVLRGRDYPNSGLVHDLLSPLQESRWLLRHRPGRFSNRMDLGELRGMPKVTSGKVPLTRPTAREVDASPARDAPKASLKRPIVTPTEQAEDAARHHKKVKVLTRRHKSRLGEGESHSRSKGKEPAAPPEEPEAPTES